MKSSSIIKDVDWMNNVLSVKLKTGKEYEYTGVPKSIYESFINAPSLGTYFNENIKSRYECVEIEVKKDAKKKTPKNAVPAMVGRAWPFPTGKI